METMENKLLKISEEILLCLDKYSTDIVKMEKILNDSKMFFPFSHKIFDDEDRVYLSWMVHPDCKKFRVCLISKNIHNDEVIFNTPFIETKLDLRLKYVHHINEFQNAFLLHLEEILTKIKNSENPFDEEHNGN